MDVSVHEDEPVERPQVEINISIVQFNSVPNFGDIFSKNAAPPPDVKPTALPPDVKSTAAPPWYEKKPNTTPQWYEKPQNTTPQWYEKPQNTTPQWYEKPRANESAPSTPDQAAMYRSVVELTDQLQQVKGIYQGFQANQGISERIPDVVRSWLSEFVDGQGTQGRAAVGKMNDWLGLDSSSYHIDRALQRQKHLVDELKLEAGRNDVEGFKQTYGLLTGAEYNKNNPAALKATPGLVSEFHRNQEQSHSFALETGAIAAAAVSLKLGNPGLMRGLFNATVSGGAGALGVRALDGYNPDKSLMSDVTTGSLAGFSVALGGRAGSLVSEQVAASKGLTTVGGNFDTIIKLTKPGWGLLLLVLLPPKARWVAYTVQ